MQLKCITKFTMNDLLKNKVLLKAFGITIFFAAGGQLSGFNVVQMYLQAIVETTATNIKSEIVSAVIGFLQLSASFCTSIVTDRFGRKPIMISTFVGMSLGLVSFFFYSFISYFK